MTAMAICRDEDCPRCGWPETYAEGTIEKGPEWIGCRQCGWTEKLGKPRRRGPKPVVERDGQFFKCKTYDVEIPDFSEMSSLQVSMWMLRNTYPKGYHARPSGLEGMAGAIGMVVR